MPQAPRTIGNSLKELREQVNVLDGKLVAIQSLVVGCENEAVPQTEPANLNDLAQVVVQDVHRCQGRADVIQEAL